MTELLKKQKFLLFYSLIAEAVLFLALLICYIFIPFFAAHIAFYIAIGLFVLSVGFDACLIISFNHRFSETKGSTDMRAAEIIGREIDYAYDFSGIGIAVCDVNDTVIWVNDFLGRKMSNIIDTNIYDDFPELKELKTKSENNLGDNYVKLKDKNKHTYWVHLKKDARMLIFRDMTQYEDQIENDKKDAPVVGYIAIDNYNDVKVAGLDDNKFEEMVSNVRNSIRDFASKSNSLLRRLSDDRYLFITDREHYDQMAQEEFPLIETVRNQYENGFTISLGIAYGFNNYVLLSDNAGSALEAALSRGGDQVVVAGFDENIQFVGGTNDAQTSRNRVKDRELSNYILNMFEGYDKIIIMPHNMADFDAIGSALGVYVLCKATNTNKKATTDAEKTPIPAYICWEGQNIEQKCRHAVDVLFSSEEMNKMFINMKQAESMITNRTLLVCVDHSNPGIALFKDLVDKFDKKIVLDHHRPGVGGDKVYEDDLLDGRGIDTGLSSASELITLLISYSKVKIDLPSPVATMLLAGITMDTKNFKDKTGNSTFEAAAYLQGAGADNDKVTEYLKQDRTEYQEVIDFYNRAQDYAPDVLVITAPDTEMHNDLIISLTANQGMTISGISASFCIARINPNTVKCSARSDGTINIENIMEKLGGGGHLGMAAAAFPNKVFTEPMTTIEVETELKKILKDYLAECRSKSNTDSAVNNEANEKAKKEK